MKPNPIPSDCRAVNPYLHVKETARMIDFLKAAFGAVELGRIVGPDGNIFHARVAIGDSVIMMSLPHEPWKIGPAMFYHYVADVDAAYRRALAAGAESVFAPMDTFYGDRYACVKDFAGNNWSVASRIENLTLAQVQERVNSFPKPTAAPDSNCQ